MLSYRPVAVVLSFLLVVLGGVSPASAVDPGPAGPTAAAGSITGNITTLDGLPVEGVDVLVRVAPEDEPVLRAASDLDGGYELLDVPDGTYRIEFVPTPETSVPGLAPLFFPGSPTWDEASDVVVAGAAVDSVDVHLAPAPTVDPTSESTTEPTTDPTTEPTSDPTVDPATDPTNGPTPEPTLEVTTDPEQEPSADPSTEPTSEPTTDPSTEPTSEPAADPTNDPIADPTVDPTPDPTTSVPVPLAAPLAAGQLVPLADGPAGTIAGTVTQAADGAAVAYATVTAYRATTYYPGGPTVWEHTAQVSTSTDGTYEFSGLIDGSYKVKATPPYGSTLAEAWLGGANENAAAVLELAGGLGLSAQDIALPEGARISGTVRGGSPLAPIPNAWVEIRRDWGGSWQTMASASTDASGAYSAAGLPAGDYRIWVSAPGGTYWISTWVGGATFDSATVYPIALDDPPLTVDAVLIEGGSIAGTVTGAGAPLAWSTVTAVRVGAETTDVLSTGTSSDGSYTLAGLLPGTYHVRVDGQYGSPWLTTWLGDTPTIAGSGTVEVTAGAETSGADVAMLRGAAISGTVTSSAGPVAGAWVYAAVPNEWGGYTSTASAQTDASGAFTLAGLAAGTYRVGVQAPYESQLLDGWAGGTDFDTATQYAVDLGDEVTGVAVELTLGGGIEGVVTGDGAPMAGVYVSAWREGSGGAQEWLQGTTTDADGGFLLSKLPAGPVRIQANVDIYMTGQSPFLTTWYDGQTSFTSATPIDVTAGGVATVALPLLTGASISGQVVAGDPAAPVEDATVEVCRESWDCRSVPTDAEGRYAAIGLAAGQYTIGAVPPAGSNLLPAFFGGGADRWSAPKLTVALGEAAVADITLPLGAEIAGRALDGAGGGVPGATVTAFRSDASATDWEWSTSTTTLADGGYVFHALTPGTYRIRVVPHAASSLAPGWYGGGASWGSATDVVVVAGDVVSDADVVLSEGVALSGRILGGPDLGVPAAQVAVYAMTQNGYEQVKSTASEADGSYVIRGLAPGTYRVQVSTEPSSEWLSAWLGGDSYYTATPIAIDGADVTADVTLLRGGIIAGTVTEAATGDPVAGSTVHLCRVYEYDSDAYCWSDDSATTDSQGAYRFTRLLPGTYRAHVAGGTDNGSPWIETWFGGEDAATATQLPVTYGTELTDVDFALVVGGAISGTVSVGTDPATPLSWGYVHIHPAVGSPYTSVAQAYISNGTFRATGLAPGTYVLRVSGDYVMPAWHGGDSYFSAERVTVVAGVEQGGISIDLAAAATISGTVTGGEGGPGIDDAYVRLCTTDTDTSSYSWDGCAYAGSTWTDPSGAFTFRGVPAGEYKLRVHDNSDGGWLPGWYGGGDGTAFAVAAGETASGLTIALQPGAGISGTITGMPSGGVSAVPVAGARVLAHLESDDGVRASARTDQTGAYHIGGLEPGSYVLQVDPPAGWLPEWFDDAQTRLGATAMVIGEFGQQLTGQDAELAAGGGLSGTVTGDGSPLASVIVSAYGADTGARVASTRTAADGTYAINGLTADQYVVRFEPTEASGNWVTEWNADRPSKLTADPIAVGLDEVVTVDASLEVGAAIRGTVLGAGDAPLGGIWMTVLDAISGARVATAETDASGQYVAWGLKPGSYTVQARSYSDDGYAEQWFSGSASQAGADPVAVTAGGEATADFHLTPAGSISGTVSGPDGPVVDTYVVACTEDGYECDGAYTLADGTYTINGLGEGRYTVRFGNWYGDLLQEWYDDALDAATATMVPVAAGSAVSGIDATLERKGRLVGTVTDELGERLAAQIRVCPVDENDDEGCRYASATTRGNWALRLASGEYRVRIAAAGFASEWYADAATIDDAQVVTVTPASEQRIDAELAGLLVPEGGTLGVSVVGDDGGSPVPVSGAWVYLQPVGIGDTYLDRFTGADGTVTFTGIPPGAYLVSVEPEWEDLWLGRYYGGDGTLSGATVIHVVDGEPNAPIAIQLDRAASISGTVTSASEPVEYVTVRAYTATGAYAGSGYTNHLGQYRVPALVGGQYRVFVDASRAPGNLASRWLGGGSDPSTASTIELGAGADLTAQDVDLVGAARIAGTVTALGSGTWLPEAMVELYAVGGAGGEIVATDWTDSEGGFSFGHLMAGQYKVRAGGIELSCDPGIVGCSAAVPTDATPAWRATWFGQTASYADATVLDLAEGGQIRTADVALPASSTEGHSVTISGPSVVIEGASLTLSGTTEGRPADGVVVVQGQSGEVWSDFATATLDGAAWSATIVAPAPGTVTYRAVLRQGETELAASAEKAVTVAPAPTVPGRPGTPTLVALGDRQVTVTWTAAPVGGSATTGYTVTANPGGAQCTTSTLQCAVTGLTNGTAYTFTAVATNSFGDGPASTPSVPLTPRTVPSAPAQPMAVAGTDGRVTVHWSAPENGGSPITGYTATADPGGAQCTTGGTLSCTVVGLANGTPYTFRVRAANVAGVGAESVPSAPASPKPTAPDAGTVSGTVRIGADPVGAGEVWISIWNDSQSFVATTDAAGEYSVLGLAPGTFTLQVSPLVAGIAGFTGPVEVTAGQNTLQDVSLAVIPPAVAPPASVSLTTVAGQDLPTDSDDIPRVSAATTKIVFEVDACASATSATYTAEDWFDGATEGDLTETPSGSGRYVAQVSLAGLSGEVRFEATITCPGAADPESVAFDIYIDPSGVVVDQHGTPIEGATATLVRSESPDGPFTVVPDGSEIMSPRNRVNPSITGADGAFSWDVVAGYYQVRVTADGCDEGATEVLTIPPPALDLEVVLRCGLPAAPDAPSAEAGDGQAVVSWEEPEDIGAAVTGYTVTASPGGRTCSTSDLTCTVTGLANGTSYTFTVAAENVAGSGPASAPSAAVTPFGVPGAPVGVLASAGNGQVALTWSAPASDGGSPITGYRVRVSPGGMDLASSGTSLTVSGLANGTAYAFTVVAVNARGTGPASAPAYATPVAPPPPPPPPPVVKVPTAVQLTASPAKGTLSTRITLTASALPGDATGTVTFEDLGHVLGVVPVVSGSASLRTKDIYGGKQTITARYSGDARFEASEATTVVKIKDRKRPSITAPKANRSAAAPRITFRAKDAGGVKLVKIRYRMSKPGRKKLGRWISAGSVPGTARSWEKAGGFAPRTRVCYQVKAVDWAGRTSRWKSKCTRVR